MTIPQPRVAVIIGLGNQHRGDDAVGPVIAARLKPLAGDGIEVVEQPGDALAMIDAWKDANTVIIIDAVVSGAEAGSVHRIDASAQPMPRDLFRHSTHSFGVSEAIELARATGRLPRRVIVYGIEGVNFEPGAALSPEVKTAAREVEALLRKDIERGSLDSQTPA